MRPTWKRLEVIYLPMLLTLLFSMSAFGQTINLRDTCFNCRAGWIDSLQYQNHNEQLGYLTKYPRLATLPPITSAMSQNIVQDYWYFDSLARKKSERQIEASLKSWGNSNDSLREMGKRLYEAVEYNPPMFEQYIYQQGFHSQGYGYSADLRRVNFRHSYWNSFPKSQKPLFHAMMGTDYILRIKILAIDSANRNYKYPNKTPEYLYRALSVVSDTLKGRVFSSNRTLPENLIDSLPTPNAGLITFNYRDDYYDRDLGEVQMVPHPNFIKDYRFSMKVGQEMVIFLYHDNRREDRDNDYYGIFIEWGVSYGALPIINGQVEDINHFWSNQDRMDYADWKQVFLNARAEILGQ